MSIITLKAILPKKKFIDPADFRKMVNQAIEATRGPMMADLEQISAGWSRPIRWRVRYKTQGGAVLLDFITRDARYKWLNFGTGAQGNKGGTPYVIRPRRAKHLVFQEGYDAKTAPGQLQGTGGGGPFGETVRADLVLHHGIEARKWTEIIMRHHRSRFGKEFMRVFRAWR